jgi:hypothetical protein
MVSSLFLFLDSIISIAFFTFGTVCFPLVMGFDEDTHLPPFPAVENVSLSQVTRSRSIKTVSIFSLVVPN